MRLGLGAYLVFAQMECEKCLVKLPAQTRETIYHKSLRSSSYVESLLSTKTKYTPKDED